MKILKRLVKFYTAVAICLALNLFAFIHPSLANCPSGMIAYWRMEEDANQSEFIGYLDESGNGSTGLCADTCPSLTSAGMVNNSQNFSGSDMGIDIPASDNLNFAYSDSFSIEVWIKRSPGISSSKEVFVGRDDLDSNMKWWIAVNSSGKAVFSLTSSAGESKLITGSKTIDNGIWHHIVAVRDSQTNQNRLYVDGEIESYASIVYGSGFESTVPVTIGYLQENSANFFFNGILDEAAIYRRALTIQEIKTHYYLSRGYCEVNDTPVKIMPLGDSITYDSHSNETRPAGQRTGYRWPLWLWLKNASYWVDFVGSEKAGEDVTPAFDYDNAGFPGISTNQLAVLLDTGINTFPTPDKQITDGPYLPFFSPDVILLHIGTNGSLTSTTPIANILDEIDEYSENITVILAKIINRVNYSQETTDFNNNVEILANNRISNGDKIITVDMENGADIIYDFTANGGDMFDDLHPSLVVIPFFVDSGYGKMADKWFATLQDILPQSILPNITSVPDTSVNHGALYTYQVFVEADPSPSVALIEPTVFPENFNYDAVSNVITWMPEASSPDLDVTIQATNWVGTDTQNFTIQVNNDPVLVDIPDQQIGKGGSFTIINLDDYVNDPDNPDESISWTYSGNDNLVVSIVDRKASINVIDAQWYGVETVTFRATDPGGLYAEDDVNFEVTNVNQAPFISGFSPVSIKENTTFTIGYDMLTVVDPDNVYPDDFTKKIYGGGNYSVSQDLITPSSGFVGKLYVPVSVNDGSDDSNIINVIVTVEEGNDDDGVTSSGDSRLCFIGAISM